MNIRTYPTAIIVLLLIFAALLCGCRDKENEMIELYQSMPHDSRLLGIWKCRGMDNYREFSPDGFFYEYERKNNGDLFKIGRTVWYTENQSILHECTLYTKPIIEHQPHGYRISNDTIYIFRFGEWTPDYVRFHGELK